MFDAFCDVPDRYQYQTKEKGHGQLFVMLQQVFEQFGQCDDTDGHTSDEYAQPATIDALPEVAEFT